MTAHAELVVRTTLREAYSDGLLRFGQQNSQPQSLSQLDAQPASAAHKSCLLQRLELFRISTTLVLQHRARYGIDKHANSRCTLSILCSIQRLASRDSRQRIPYLAH